MHHHHVPGFTGDGTACVIMRPLRALPQTISDVGLIGGRLVKTVARLSWPQAYSPELVPRHCARHFGSSSLPTKSLTPWRQTTPLPLVDGSPRER
jgi:hypothetical protein